MTTHAQKIAGKEATTWGDAVMAGIGSINETLDRGCAFREPHRSGECGGLCEVNRVLRPGRAIRGWRDESA